ncbi:MAG: phosphoribosylamine--glycine ligase [Candidatus Kerfeldbacteria bacterium]|nr:phosphoribosylamine--glycine ligase [Candidatus Kerfeldbacteria bacterium]
MGTFDRRILVVGGGAREHALARAFSLSDSVGEVFVAPGNAGIEDAHCVPIEPMDFQGLVSFARGHRVDLTVVGGEEPLVAGIRSVFRAEGLPIFGPTPQAAMLEGSKAFAKRFMEEYRIPTAKGEIFFRFEDAIEAVRTKGSFPLVIKKSGLAQGKGVRIAFDVDHAEAALRALFTDADRDEHGLVVLEERLFGDELSVFALVNGRAFGWFGEARDYKSAYEDGRGPMTGGMGAYAPVRVVDATLRNTIEQQILTPTLEGLAEMNIPYEGFLYLGLMLTSEGPKVLEYNCRLGDPEAQVLLPRLESEAGEYLTPDLAELLLGVMDGNVPKEVEFASEAAVGVVLASEGYPGRVDDGRLIGTFEHAEEMGALVFTGGVAPKDDDLVTRGGRICTVVGLGADLTEARRKAYAGIAQIDVAGAFFRRDIGYED